MIELHTGKFLKKLEQREHCENLKTRAQMIGHTLKHGGMLLDILEGSGKEKGKKKANIGVFFYQIMKDMGCETLIEVKELMG